MILFSAFERNRKVLVGAQDDNEYDCLRDNLSLYCSTKHLLVRNLRVAIINAIIFFVLTTTGSSPVPASGAAVCEGVAMTELILAVIVGLIK